MHFVSTSIYQFRNFFKLSVSFNEKVNFFIGENGQGKTNLLEALYISTRGQSFRPSTALTFHNNKVIQEEPQLSIKSEIKKNDLEYEIKLNILGNKKEVFLNNKRITSSKILHDFPVVLFSPESLSAIKEGPETRRQLIDEFIITHKPENTVLIQNFRKAWKTRNRILSNYAAGQSDLQKTALLLDSINVSYFNAAVDLTVARIEALSEIQQGIVEAMNYIFENKLIITCDYIISEKGVLRQAEREKIEKIILDRAIQLKSSELAVGTSLVGPHKHDIRFYVNGNDSRYNSSQGQQRALIVCFKLAQILYHNRIHKVKPVLMLDDVLSELDPEKRMRLITFIQDFPAQIFITSTDVTLPRVFNQERATVYTLSNGEIISSY